MPWTQAHALVSEVNGGSYPNCSFGHSDWRLPNANEMLSLTHWGQDDPRAWLLTQGFTRIDQYWHWTSTTAVDSRYVVLSSVDGEVDWQEALDFVEGINAGTCADCAAGHDGWRLPNIVELRSRTSLAISTSHRRPSPSPTTIRSARAWTIMSSAADCQSSSS